MMSTDERELLAETLKALTREVEGLKKQVDDWKSLCEHLMKKLEEKGHV